ncbi:hypothetical protein GIB67_017214 [Kingdonia uniflora]|uniref:Uncharacterized protein n=1 Tax=Kingdonia uniflora TaxID=39325 RepID=A0A7J7NKG1_9MAGN|nr:hypothetical protein GIB67_017214 [Kingdonia uniflora]
MKTSFLEFNHCFYFQKKVGRISHQARKTQLVYILETDEFHYRTLSKKLEKKSMKQLRKRRRRRVQCLFTNVYVKGFGTDSFGADRKEVKAVLL